MKTGFTRRRQALGLPSRVDGDFPRIYEPIAHWLKSQIDKMSKPFILGVNGAQGSGKSTFCDLMSATLEADGVNVTVCSIDDFYLTRADRLRLSEEIHPLCLNRGVPGTHDLSLALETLPKLSQADPNDITLLPRFDKAKDDRCPEEDWEQVRGRPDLVILEGWCVGAQDLPPWESPINTREATDDPTGIWASWSQKALEDNYSELFAQLSGLLMIQVPSMETVHRSRWLQEQKLWKWHEADANLEVYQGLMTQVEVHQYVQLFERLTLHMLKTMPTRADVLIRSGDSFDYELVRLPKS